MPSSPPQSRPPSLRELTAAPDYFARVSQVVLQIEAAFDFPTLVDHLHEAVACIGADVAAFLSFLRDDCEESFRYLLACDPQWCVDYEQQSWYADDPWLAYARRHSEPIKASDIPARDSSEEAVVRLARHHGFLSAVILPVASSGGLSRLGMLCLGSRSAGFFDDEGFGPFKVIAQPLASALHEGCLRILRAEALDAWRLTKQDLTLLDFEHRGFGTKQIATALGTTESSVNSGFQRLNARVGARNRKAAAQLAAEYGLI